MTEQPLLEVRNLKKYFNQGQSFTESLLGRDPDSVQAVDDVSFKLYEKESRGVIGESGCGKTTLLMVLLGLQDRTDGEIIFRGEETSQFGRAEWKEFRSNVQVIFQDPFDSLDPKMSVRETLGVSLDVHDMDNKEERIKETLSQVELNPPERYIDQLPKQLSGGEKQRVAIARALVVEPEIILADEPVSMLDVSTQASILQLLSRLREEMNLSLMYISHDLSTVGYICDNISVMYLGRVVESAPTMEVLDNPKHPYTKELIKAIPIPDPHHGRTRTQLDGSTPDPINVGEGCRFRDRCPERMDVCEKTPAVVEEDNTKVACHLYYEHDEHDGETATMSRGSSEVSR